MGKRVTHMVIFTLKHERGSNLLFVKDCWKNEVEKFLEIDVETI